MSSGSPSARRERRAGRIPPPPPPDDDQTAWLVTFSDLVLQLFAFVLVATVLGGATRSTGSVPPPPPPVESATPPSPPPVPSPAEADLARADAPAPDRVASLPPPRPAPDPAEVVPPPEPVVPPIARPAEDVDAAGDRVAALGRRMQAVADAQGHGDDVRVQVRDSDVVVTLSDTITFPSATAELLPSARPMLRQIGALAAAMPEFDVEVTGHTDDVPIHTGAFPSNLELSLARAAGVVREMIAEAPDLAARTVAAGLGEHRPVASNADESGRSKNRRVEVRLVRATLRPSVSAAD